MDRVTICDHTFLQHTGSASIGGGNIGVGPTHFEWEYADAQTARFVTDGDIKHARGEGQVAWLLEPLGLHPENYYEAIGRKDEFDAILMHSAVLDNMYYPYGGSWIAFDKWGMHKKTKNVSMLLSDKDSMPGHRLRNDVVELFGDRMDIFRNIPDKFEALAPYRFSVIIESERTTDYFTEKIIDCMSVGTIPIYWGSPLIHKHFNVDGMILANSLHEIGTALKYIATKSRYKKYIEAATKNLERCKDYAICEDNIYRMHPELFR